MTTFADDADWDDPSFLSQLDDAEAKVVKRLSQEATVPDAKRQRTSQGTQNSPPAGHVQSNESEGDYTAALKGSKSSRWEARDGRPTHEQRHGQYGPSYGGAGESQLSGTVPERLCPCGAGVCTVLTAHTEKNMGRRFYRCPRGKEEGCSFFDWCDAGPTGGGQFVAQPRQGDPSPSPFPEAGSDAASQPPLECPCGEGLCSVLTAKTEKNMGRMFYRCPKSQGTCNFFKWCDELSRDKRHDGGSWPSQNIQNSSAGRSGYQSGYQNSGPGAYGGNSSQAGTGGNVNPGNCFSCGQPGHWSNNCPNPGNSGGPDKGSKANGSCFKCGQPGHWAPNCPNSESPQKQPPRSKPLQHGGNASSCYTCGQPGHWAPNCPNANSPQKQSSRSNDHGNGDSCFKCGQLGHWSSNCPNTPSPQKQPSRSNFAPKPGNSGTFGGSGKGGGCFKCGQPDHWASNCTSKDVSPVGQWSNRNFNSGSNRGGTPGGQGGRGTSGHCYKCGKPGHWAPNCPIKPSPEKATSGRKSGYQRGSSSSGFGRR